MKYYDLVASLPRLPRREHIEWLPITELRLNQRLGLLEAEHAVQLARVRALVPWRPTRVLEYTDDIVAAEFEALMAEPLEPVLRDYIAVRIDQSTILAALRRKAQGHQVPGAEPGLVGQRAGHIRLHWDDADFRLGHVHPWIPTARDRLAKGDALGLEHLFMDVTWHWLERRAENDMFGFPAVVAYYFKWDILRAWQACNPDQAAIRFTGLIDEVTRV